jgi:hypothetical protein
MPRWGGEIGWESASGGRRGSGGERFLVVPEHPAIGVAGQFVGVPFILGEVLERIGPAQRSGVDQAHEQVVYVRTADGLEEQGVLAV